MDEGDPEGRDPVCVEAIACDLYSLSAPSALKICCKTKIHEAAAMELHHNGMLAALELFRHEEGNFNLMVANLLV